MGAVLDGDCAGIGSGISGRGDRRIRGRFKGNDKIIEVKIHSIGVMVGRRGSLSGSSGTFTFLAFETHGHHSPGEVLHPLLVGQLGLGAGIEAPDLGGQGILPLQLIGTFSGIPPLGKEGVTEQVIMDVGRRGRGGKDEVIMIVEVVTGGGGRRSHMGRKSMAQARHGVDNKQSGRVGRRTKAIDKRGGKKKKKRAGEKCLCVRERREALISRERRRQD